MTLLILNSKDYPKSEDFTVEYATPLKIKRVALQSFSLWVSWYNICKAYENNKLSFYDGSLWHDLTIPDGNYTLGELNDYMTTYFRNESPPIQFGVIFARQRFVIKLKEHYKLDLSKSKLHEILGFEPKVYEEVKQEAKYVANISRSVDDIHIHCDIIEGAYLNQFASEVIHSFTPAQEPGSLLSKDFDRPIFFKTKSNHVYRIRMRLTNQDGVPINLNNQRVLYRLLVE